MRFFEHQELARRNSRRLIVMFVLAVIAIVVAVNVAATFIYHGVLVPGVRNAPALPTGFYFTNTLVVLGLILGGTWIEMTRLKAGGRAVAEMVGARELDTSTRDLLDRRLLNVVEEMALASGVPMPRVYVMDDENAINAFAAGHSIDDAVVAVTRGTLTRLTRDELQGVVAHEFSHILNGDMALNLRMIGVLYGLLIVALAGRFLMHIGARTRGGSRGSGNAIAVLVAAGIALWVLGYIGVICGRLIKAGVSRQREFLADASAVQFTRNPDSIGGALRKIAGLSQTNGLGTRIEHPQAESLSHLFLGAARPSFVRGIFATHPPLDERIRRIYGRALPAVPAPENAVALALGGLEPAPVEERRSPIRYTPSDTALVAGPEAAAVGGGASAIAAALPSAASPVSGLVAAGAVAAAANIEAGIGTARPWRGDFALDAAQRELLASLQRAAGDGTRAQVLVLGMLLDGDADVRAQQRTRVAEAFGQEAADLVHRYEEQIALLPPGARQPLVDVAMPALRRLPEAVRAKLLRTAHGLVAADGRVTVAEFLLYSILKRRLGPAATRPVDVRYAGLADVAPDVALVLSLIAAVRLPQHAERAFNAGAVLLRDVPLAHVAVDALRLDAVSQALDRLNQLAPLVKPQLIKAATAAAFVDDRTNWKAASALRMICAALDAPLPPQVLQAEAETTAAA